MSNTHTTYRLPRLLLAAVAVILCATQGQAQEAQRTTRDFELGSATEILANMMRELETRYVDVVSAYQLLENAAFGLTKATDPYSEFISEEDMAEFQIMTTGKYGGVGSLIRKRGDYVLFAQPYKGSPSDEAGIKIGDKILAIDGEDMKGVSTADISSRLKGEPNTSVEVVIERNIDSKCDTLRLMRRRISIPSVPYAGIIRDGIGYICHNDFIDGSYNELRRELERLMATDTLRGLILDYRANGGGVMQEAVDIASLFVPRGERIVSIMGRDSSSLQHFATEHQPLAPDLPIIILVSSSSASASEILAGAMQDLDRAVIVGQRTFGKGLVQGTRHIGYNTYLKYTTSKYYIPSGRCIQALNYSARNSNGSATTTPDSLLTAFETRGGRVVYDGGGIVPDIKIEPQYVSRFALVLYTMGYLEDWADEYVRKHPDLKIDVRTFSISDEDYADFTAFISEKDVPYESETRLALKKLEEAIKNDLYDETLGDALESMRSQIKDDKLSNMKTYRNEIIDALNSDIILRYAYNSGALEYSTVKNSTVQQAIDLLLDTAEYRRILREQSPEKR